MQTCQTKIEFYENTEIDQGTTVIFWKVVINYFLRPGEAHVHGQ